MKRINNTQIEYFNRQSNPVPANTLRELIQVYHRLWEDLRSNIQVAEPGKETWQALTPLFEQISAQNAVFIMIWNLITNRIIYTVDKRSICGYDASLWWFQISIATLVIKYKFCF